MIKNKVVFVLGAGVSCPYEYPLGNELISNIVNVATIRFELLSALGFSIEKSKEFANALEKSGLFSIDLFLEKRPEFMDIGKLCIAIVLLGCENPKSILKMRTKKTGVYHYIYNQMTSGCSSLDEFINNNVAFISFNYDRSLEFFLYNSLLNTYGKSEVDTLNFIKMIPIKHVHGWLFDDVNQLYGYEYKPIPPSALYSEYFREASKNIHIISEKPSIQDEVTEAINLLDRANEVYFLGLSYHDQNMKKLGLEEKRYYDRTEMSKDPFFITEKLIKKVTFRGTSLGLGKAEMKYIEDKWNVYLPTNSVSSQQFLKDFGIYK